MIGTLLITYGRLRTSQPDRDTLIVHRSGLPYLLGAAAQVFILVYGYAVLLDQPSSMREAMDRFTDAWTLRNWWLCHSLGLVLALSTVGDLVRGLTRDRYVFDQVAGTVSRSGKQLAKLDDIAHVEVKRTKYPLWFRGPHHQLVLVLTSGETIQIEPDVKALVLDSARSAANAIGNFLAVEVIQDTD
jgi:hypothetical protein